MKETTTSNTELSISEESVTCLASEFSKSDLSLGNNEEKNNLETNFFRMNMSEPKITEEHSAENGRKCSPDLKCSRKRIVRSNSSPNLVKDLLDDAQYNTSTDVFANHTLAVPHQQTSKEFHALQEGNTFLSEENNGNCYFNGIVECDNERYAECDIDSVLTNDKVSFSRCKSNSSLSSSDEFIGSGSHSLYGATFNLNLLQDDDTPNSSLVPPSFKSSSQSFGAYSSDTSLDYDAFTKSSKCFKWNGSASLSDLTTLFNEFDNKSDSKFRCSTSASDLISFVDSSTISDKVSGTTSFIQWSSEVQDDFEEGINGFPSKLNTSSFVFTPQPKSRNFLQRAPANPFLLEEDSDEEMSSCSESEDEEEMVINPYHGGPPPTLHGLISSENCLATIDEDVEGELGCETGSGVWVSDTDSVVLGPSPPGSPVHRISSSPNIPSQRVHSSSSSLSQEEDRSKGGNEEEEECGEENEFIWSDGEEELLFVNEEFKDLSVSSENLDAILDSRDSETRPVMSNCNKQDKELVENDDCDQQNGNNIFPASTSCNVVDYLSNSSESYDDNSISVPFIDDIDIKNNGHSSDHCPNNNFRSNIIGGNGNSSCSVNENEKVDIGDAEVEFPFEKREEEDLDSVSDSSFRSHDRSTDNLRPSIDSVTTQTAPVQMNEMIEIKRGTPCSTYTISSPKLTSFSSIAPSPSNLISSSETSTDVTPRICDASSNVNEMKEVKPTRNVYVPETMKLNPSSPYGGVGFEGAREEIKEGIDRFNDGTSPHYPFTADQRHLSEREGASSACSVNEVGEDVYCSGNDHADLKSLRRPYSLVDLRHYYNSDSEEEFETMKNFKKFKPACFSFTNTNSEKTTYFPSNPSSSNHEKGNQGLSRSRSNPQKMRKHHSMYASCSDEYIWEPAPRTSYIQNDQVRRRSVPRPKPLSLDMAEEFLSQEAINTSQKDLNRPLTPETHNKTAITANYPPIYSETKCSFEKQSGNKCLKETNIEHNLNANTHSARFNQDMKEEGGWHAAHIPGSPIMSAIEIKPLKEARHSHEITGHGGVSEQPFPNKSDHVQFLPCARSDEARDDCDRRSVNLVRTSSPEMPNIGENMNRVHSRTYGPHGEVQVYVARKDPPEIGSNRALPSGKNASQGTRHLREVTFSPQVKEVNWRESYLEPEDGEDYMYTEMEEKPVLKLKVKTCESPKLQKCEKITKFSSNTNVTNDVSAVNNNKSNNKSNKMRDNASDSHIQSRNEINLNHNKDVTDKYNQFIDQVAPDKANNNPKQQPHSDANPIWQRLKFTKGKGPRPKVPPKPSSLSPRSSDGESHQLSSSPSSQDGESSSPSSPEIKCKKMPSTSRFILWGSKREKKKCRRQSADPKEVPPAITCLPPFADNPPPDLLKAIQVNRNVNTNGDGRCVLAGDVADKAPNHESSPSKSNPCLPQTTWEEYMNTKSTAGAATKKEESILDNEFMKVNDEFYKIRESILKQCSNKINEQNGHKFNAEVNGNPVSSSEYPQSNGSPLIPSTERKPPLPPVHVRNNQLVSKVRSLSARRCYLSSRGDQPSIQHHSPVPPPDPQREHVKGLSTGTPAVNGSPYSGGTSTADLLRDRFDRFSRSTRAEREKLARSSPLLNQLEESVRSGTARRIDSRRAQDSTSADTESDGSAAATLHGQRILSPSTVTADGGAASHGTPFVRQFYRHRQNQSKVSAEFDRLSQRSRSRCRSQSIGVLETDLDTGTSVEVLRPQETNLDDLYHDLQNFLDTLPQIPLGLLTKDKTKAKSLLQLDDSPPQVNMESSGPRGEDSRARSMEFLLDDENRAAVKAPENELMKEGERKMSEAELRVRRSLQRLDVPDWMKSSSKPSEGFILRRKDSAPAPETGGWAGFSNKTSSMSSLGSFRGYSGMKFSLPPRASVRSYGGVTSPSSISSVSPSPSDKDDKSSFQYPLSRWSTSRINSGTVTPTGSILSQKSLTSYGRQPYLGWRSNTSLNNSLAGSQTSLTSPSYQSPAERLAQSFLQAKDREQAVLKATANQKRNSASSLSSVDRAKVNSNRPAQRPTITNDVHSSIKEVTSAIVHYCKETSSPRPTPKGSPNPSQREAAPKVVWVESSFVGSKPITSPETPTKAPASHAINGHKEEKESRPSRPSPHSGEYLMAR